MRSQWHHVIDVAPTVLEAAGLPQPKSVNGTVQTPIEGVSMLYSFDNAKAPDRHKTQYFEIFGNRAIYSEGWFAGTVHRAAWEFKPRRPLQEDIWELYDTTKDFSLANDLAAQNPAKLKEMQELFLSEAAKYHVLPLDDRSIERTNSQLAGRPDLMGGRTSLTVYEGMRGMSENVFINAKNRSHTITAEVEIPSGGADGVLLAQAGRFGGWSLYQGWQAGYTRTTGLDLRNTPSLRPRLFRPVRQLSSSSSHMTAAEPGKAASAPSLSMGKRSRSGRIDQTQANIFSADEGTDVGLDEGTAVTSAYEIPFRFKGKIRKVTVDLK